MDIQKIVLIQELYECPICKTRYKQREDAEKCASFVVGEITAKYHVGDIVEIYPVEDEDYNLNSYFLIEESYINETVSIFGCCKDKVHTVKYRLKGTYNNGELYDDTIYESCIKKIIMTSSEAKAYYDNLEDKMKKLKIRNPDFTFSIEFDGNNQYGYTIKYSL